MNILTHSDSLLYSNSSLFDFLSDFTTSFFPSSPVLHYAHTIENISRNMHQYSTLLIKTSLEKLDNNFRNLPGRTLRYYVKQTRNRTIITPFGQVTYKRTEYVDRQTKESFCPVDASIGLGKRIRYDACIQSMIYEEYANSNSMIKVGERIGIQAFCHFSLDNLRKQHAIPRQTVYNILKRFNKIDIIPQPRDKTPETIYIMADEKWIPLQGTNENEPRSRMVKGVVIFEGVEPVITKKGRKTKRNRLVGKHYIAAADNENIWELALDALAQLYQLENIKNIFILGDGAQWIKNGVFTFQGLGPRVVYALDRFHFSQAIFRVTTNNDERDLLQYYAYTNMKHDFIYLLDLITKNNEKPTDKFTKSVNYLKNHWDDYRKMIVEVKIGCAMEQVISHVFASNFTSVPKAYGKENLGHYVQGRMNHMNQIDLRMAWIEAIDYSLEHPNETDITLEGESSDFSMFDHPAHEEPNTVNLSRFSWNTITKF